jgi:hypothetical protein
MVAGHSSHSSTIAAIVTIARLEARAEFEKREPLLRFEE